MTRMRYLADSLDEAMHAARRDLGAGARVLFAAEAARAGLWPFARPQPAEVIVEVDGSAARVATRQASSGDALRLRVAARLGLARAMAAAADAARHAAGEAEGAFGQVREAEVHGTPAVVPAVVARLAARLRAQGLPDDLVRTVVQRVVRAAADEHDPSPVEVRAEFVRALAQMVAVLPARDAMPARADGRPHIVAMVGATGVGKTTTLAKVAADCRVRLGLRVGIVAADAFRVGAVEQLAAYAQILGAPMRAVDGAASLRSAMLDLSWCDVVLVDTAGRSHRDASRIGEISSLLAVAAPDETHLVISGTASASAQVEAAQAFGRTRPTSVVLSKLDECESAVSLLLALRAAGRPASWFTTGQEVPDDLERADATALAERVVREAECEHSSVRDEVAA